MTLDQLSQPITHTVDDPCKICPLKGKCPDDMPCPMGYDFDSNDKAINNHVIIYLILKLAKIVRRLKKICECGW